MATKVQFNEVPKLLEVLEKWRPDNYPVYYLVHNCYKNNNKWPCVDIYIDNDNINEMTSIVCYIQDYYEASVANVYFLYSVNNTKLSWLIDQDGVVAWEKGVVYWIAIPESTTEIVENIAKKHRFKFQLEANVYMYTLKNTDKVRKVANQSLPKGFTLSALKKDDAHTLQDLPGWRYGCQPPLEQCQNFIQYMPCLGIYNEDQQLISWARIKEYGDIGVTGTKPHYRRQGFASIITAKLSLQILDAGLSPWIITSEDNHISINFHTKLGYQVTDVKFVYCALTKI
ncbi:glycine N-acyltransferase-like [Saccoglossus kowalevskii]